MSDDVTKEFEEWYLISHDLTLDAEEKINCFEKMADGEYLYYILRAEYKAYRAAHASQQARIDEILQRELAASNKYAEYVDLAEAKIDALEAQLPEEMQDCTIIFKECEYGHGRLTALNWIQHDCQTCKIKELEAKLAEVSKDAEIKSMPQLSSIGRFCTVHNADKSKCDLHNLQCAFPSCCEIKKDKQ